MSASSLSRLRGALVRTRGACARAARTTIASATSSLPARDSFWRGVACGLVYGALLTGWVCLIWFVTAYAAQAAESPPVSLPDQVKELGTEHGLLGLGLAMALTTIGLLFGMLIKSWSDRRAETEKGGLALKAALADQEKEHLAAMKEKDEQHATDRARWAADTALLQEARVGLLREVMTGLTNATTFIQTTQNVIAERSNTSAELTASVRELVSLVQAHRSASDADMGRLTNRIKDALDALAEKPAPSRRAS